MVRQLPKSRGFTALNNKAVVVSLTKLNVFDDGATVDLNALKAKDLVKKTTKVAKILGGEIKKKLNVKLPASKSAKEAIEKAGGKIL